MQPTARNNADLNASINQLLKSVETMRGDVQQINTRINILERSLTEVKNHQLRKKVSVPEIRFAFHHFAMTPTDPNRRYWN